ncbi:MAG: transcriptional regulator [Oscillibacter sp.]|nr:transcriptional regulator [Oscillibacter sp.]
MSVPDADVLSKIADVLETKESILLGGAITEEVARDAVAVQLAKISEELAIKNRRNKRIWKTLGTILMIIVVFNILLVIFNIYSYKNISDNNTTMIEMDDVDK